MQRVFLRKQFLFFVVPGVWKVGSVTFQTHGTTKNINTSSVQTAKRKLANLKITIRYFL